MKKLSTYLTVLAVMIIGLMALGAGVRTMNAGLSCPDWPLCFGKVIPDFHPGVWFEFVHRAYAGVVAILFAVAVVWVLRSPMAPAGAKRAAKWGAAFLALQIVMGGLTVLLLVKAVIVTGHLLLATAFLSCVLWMLFSVRAARKLEAQDEGSVVSGSDHGLKFIAFVLPALVFLQIAIGGLVASTYAGSVCVDWPLCNGVWVPTWKGAIGLQIIHRFFAYGLVLLFGSLAVFAWIKRATMDASLRRLLWWSGGVVIAQTVVGILNLLYFIPPHITVSHQTLALVLLGLQLKLAHHSMSFRSFRSRAAQTGRLHETLPLSTRSAES